MLLAQNTRQYCNEVEAQSVSSHREFSDWAQGANPTGDIILTGRIVELIRKGGEQSQYTGHRTGEE
jgi:hypothetical protein